MLTGNRPLASGTLPMTFADQWRVSADNGATWTVVATGLTFSDEMLATHAGKRLQFRTVATNSVNSTPSNWSEFVMVPGQLQGGTPTTPVTLSDLTLTATTGAKKIGTASVAAGALLATVSGNAQGSAISVPQGETRYVLNTAKTEVRVGAFALTEDGPLDLVVLKTLAGATNSPHPTTLSLTIEAASAVVAPQPLNGLSGVVAAVGDTLLRSAYTGPLWRVRRNSDGAEQDIGFNSTTKLIDAAALRAFAGASTGTDKLTLAKGYDQSGAGLHFTSIDAAHQPPINLADSTAGGNPTVLFTGNHILSMTGFPVHLTDGKVLAQVVATVAADCPGNTRVLSFHPDNIDTPEDHQHPWALVALQPGSDGTMQSYRDQFGLISVPATRDVQHVYSLAIDSSSNNSTIWSDTVSGTSSGGNGGIGFARVQIGGRTIVGDDGFTGGTHMTFRRMIITSDPATHRAPLTTDALTTYAALGTVGDVGSGGGGGGETTPPDTAFDAFTRIYDPATVQKRAAQTTPVTGIAFAPAVPQPSTSNDIIGFGYTCASGDSIPARIGRFAINIAPGKLLLTDNCEVFWPHDGTSHKVQVVPLSVHPDASTYVDHALIVGDQPALNGTTPRFAMLRKGAAALTGSAVGTGAYASSPITGTSTLVQGHGLVTYDGDSQTYTDPGTTFPINAAVSITPSQFLGTGWTTDVRYTGPMASERRHTYDYGGRPRIVVDVTTYSDGNQEIEFYWGCDQQFRSDPNNLGGYTFNLDVKQGGTSVIALSGNSARIGRRNGWGKIICTALSTAQNARMNPPETTIIFDAGEMMRLGVVAPYNLGLGVNESVLAGYQSQVSADAGFRGPYSLHGIASPNMGQTGGREDLGIATARAAAYLISMDPRARQCVIEQAESFRGLPVNDYDPIRQAVVNVFPDTGTPNIWMDPRGYNSNPSNTATEGDAHIRRDWDGGHQPSMSAIAYMITGRRQLADILETQANLALTFMYKDGRNKSVGGETHDWCFMQNNQPREAGWAARDVGQGVRLLPDTAKTKANLRKAMNFTFAYLVSQIPAWKPAQGEPFGWLPYTNPYDSNNLKAWMNDHIAAGCWACCMAGCENTRIFMQTFQKNFIVGRGQQEDVLSLFKATAVYYDVGNSHDILDPNHPFLRKTWATLAIITNDFPVDGYGEGNAGGNYNQLFHRSQTLYASLFNDADARQVAAKIRANKNKANSFMLDSNLRSDPLENFLELSWV